MATTAELDKEAKRIAASYQGFFREGSELQGYAEINPGRIVLYVTRGKDSFEAQGKAAGHIARTAIEDFGIDEVVPPVMNFLIQLDQSDRLIQTPQSESAPFVCLYAQSFKKLS